MKRSWFLTGRAVLAAGGLLLAACGIPGEAGRVGVPVGRTGEFVVLDGFDPGSGPDEPALKRWEGPEPELGSGNIVALIQVGGGA